MMKLYGDGAGIGQMGDGFTNQGPVMQNPDFGGIGLNPQGNYGVKAKTSGYRPQLQFNGPGFWGSGGVEPSMPNPSILRRNPRPITMPGGGILDPTYGIGNAGQIRL
jgi:hypothetical protein